MTGTIRLTKHHGSGNDFLVMLAPDGDIGDIGDVLLGAEEVAALCDRRKGLGADGLIVGRRGSEGADLQMHLTNADGSFAEMSGNGIRCLVQAAVAAAMVEEGTVVVDTGAGRRQVEYTDLGSGLGFADVDMGQARVSEDLRLDHPPVSFAGAGAVRRACEVNVGNPHVVLLLADRQIDLRSVGPLMERSVEGGANIEAIRLVEPGAASAHLYGTSAIDIEVWERGVGITGSCGTGACAAAAAARSWGMTAAMVEVRSGGGSLQVRLGDTSVRLAGPARMVGAVTVDREVLHGLVAERSKEVVAAL